MLKTAAFEIQQLGFVVLGIVGSFVGLTLVVLVVVYLDGSGDPWRLQRLCEADPGAVFAGGDRLLVDAPQIRFLGGFVSVLANLWPGFCSRIVRDREAQLRAAILDRVSRVEEAGGIRAVKATLNMGFRPPLTRPVDPALDRVPGKER